MTTEPQSRIHSTPTIHIVELTTRELVSELAHVQEGLADRRVDRRLGRAFVQAQRLAALQRRRDAILTELNHRPDRPR